MSMIIIIMIIISISVVVMITTTTNDIHNIITTIMIGRWRRWSRE